MSQFESYAAYYDLLYNDKDYQGEADYIEKKIKAYAPDTKKIIELGCGTGIHAQLLFQKGYDITGVDISEGMIERAKERNPELHFICDNIQTFSVDERVDTILALFHVVSYQTTIKELINTIKNVRTHLKEGGLFLFDVWHGPAVMTIKPDTKVKRLKKGKLKVTRIAEPTQDFEASCVDVSYQIFINDDSIYSEINEVHRMRYFFKTELEVLFKQFHMEIVHSEKWLDEEVPSENSWGVLYAVRN